MEFLAKTSVSVKILTVKVTLPESLQASPEADKRKILWSLSRLSGKRYGFDNIVGAHVHMDETTPHMHTKSLQSSMTKERCHRHSAKDMFNRTDLKSFHKWFIREREFGSWRGRMKTSEKMKALAYQSIKELKAENKELAELKIVCLLKLKSRMKKLNVWARERARTWAGNELLKQEMAQTGLFEKVKEKLFEKDVDRGLELAGARLQKNGQGNIID